MTGVLAVAGALAVFFAVLMVFQSTLYGSALCFMGVLVQIAAVFYVLEARLLAFLQILVYAGAIMVLVVTAIMASPPKLGGLWAVPGLPRPLVLLVLGAAAAELAAFAVLGLVPAVGAMPPWPGLQADFSSVLFGPYALLTETVGLMILLAALAVVEAWRPGEGPGPR